MRGARLAAGALVWLAAGAGAGEIDPETGLAVAPNYPIVKAHCTACHSGRLIAQNRGDREHWVSLIRWMQETQNLWGLPPAVETAVLDYLSSNYGPRNRRVRRRNLDPALLPPPEPAPSPLR